MGLHERDAVADGSDPERVPVGGLWVSVKVQLRVGLPDTVGVPVMLMLGLQVWLGLSERL